MKKTNILKGHTLFAEGAAAVAWWPGAWPSGPGQGRCSCGQLSPELPNRAARKRWHREHKDSIRANQEGTTP